jgi:hypothetical protein
MKVKKFKKIIKHYFFIIGYLVGKPSIEIWQLLFILFGSLVID